MNNLSDPWDIPDRSIDPPDEMDPDEIDAEYDRLRDEEILRQAGEDTVSALFDIARLPGLARRQIG